jgi:uncharacterized protein YjdB
MKRVSSILVAAALLTTAALTSCGDDKNNDVAVTEVAISETSKTLDVDGSFTLTATVKPDDATNKTVTWKSSNLAAATIEPDGNSCKVTAVGEGTSTITVTAVGNNTAQCVVTVSETSRSVTGISLDKNTAKLVAAGATETLTATVAPSDAENQAVTWTVEAGKEGVVTMTPNGKQATITAVGNGTAKITVTADDKSNGTITAECTVTVELPDVTGATLNKTELTLYQIGDSEKLSFTVAPVGAAATSVLWETDDETVAAVAQDGTVTAVNDGTANITVTADGKTSEPCVVTVVTGAWNEITNKLVNTAYPFAMGESRGVSWDGATTWWVAEGWNGSKETLENPTVELGPNPDSQPLLCLLTMTSGYTAHDPINNAKLFQTINLDAGRYRFKVNFASTIYDNTRGVAYIVANSGNDLPNVDDKATALAYRQLPYSANWFDLEIEFEVTATGAVSLGFIANLINDSVKILSVELFKWE